jgi:transposase
MTWKATSPVEERLKFIAAYLEDEEPFVHLCERFGICRSKGYKWVQRYEEGGVDALRDRSRRPHSNSRAIAASTVELLISARKNHPSWGPRKLVSIIAREYPNLLVPAPSTVGDILQRKGLVAKRRRKRSSTGYGQTLGGYDAPNTTWCADFKGWFLVGQKKCSPLTITDGFSRYLLCCTAMRRTLTALVRRAFESTFTEFGLPEAIRTDNGPPFVAVTTGGLSNSPSGGSSSAFALNAFFQVDPIRMVVTSECTAHSAPRRPNRHSPHSERSSACSIVSKPSSTIFVLTKRLVRAPPRASIKPRLARFLASSSTPLTLTTSTFSAPIQMASSRSQGRSGT